MNEELTDADFLKDLKLLKEMHVRIGEMYAECKQSYIDREEQMEQYTFLKEKLRKYVVSLLTRD